MPRMLWGVEVEALWRRHDGVMSLYALPAGTLRPNASPLDHWRRWQAEGREPPGWLWIGTPGWWGGISEERQEEAKVFLADLGDLVPDWPGEFSRF